MMRNSHRTGSVATVLLVIVVLLGLVAWMVFFRVEFTEHVLVQTFGKTTRVLNGATDAGLHARIPFVQQVVRYDARTQVFEDTMNELATNDKQNITLTTFCAWRIVDPVQFQASAREIQAGQERIRIKLRAAKSNVIGNRIMAELVNTDPSNMRITEIEQAMLDAIRVEAREDYGVEVQAVGFKTLGLPESVSEKVIEAMKEERKREVGRYEAAGQAEAMAIRERARSAQQQILAFADRKAGEIRAQGDRAAARYYEEFEKDPQLAAFLRSLESLKKELAGRSIFLLDGSVIPAVGYFGTGAPKPADLPRLAPTATAPAKVPQTPEAPRR